MPKSQQKKRTSIKYRFTTLIRMVVVVVAAVWGKGVWSVGKMDIRGLHSAALQQKIAKSATYAFQG